jgi:hypothetical protein
LTETTTLVTTAPESLDGFGTQTVEELPYRSRTKGTRYRLVILRADAADWQRARYRSGQHATLPRSEFDAWVDLGLVEPIT